MSQLEEMIFLFFFFKTKIGSLSEMSDRKGYYRLQGTPLPYPPLADGFPGLRI